MPGWCPAPNIAPDARARDLRNLAAAVRPDDVALLHLSIGSAANEVFRSLPCRRAVLYHNVTPPRFFERTNPATAAVLAAGLDAVRGLAGCGADAWADSAFNAAELRAMGWRDPKVFPLLVPAGFARRAPDRGVRARLLRIYHEYRTLAPASRLVLAGRTGGMETYLALLRGMAYTLALPDVWFTDYLRPEELAACYATASAFVCASDHEGFCAPLLEAMAWRVPVFAAASAAVPETLGGAGVLFDPATPPETVAATIHRVLRDPALKEAVLAKQDARLARFQARDAWAELRAVLGLPA